jgi:hypothetical protein
MPDTDGDGPTYRLVLALYVATGLAAAVVAVLAVRGTGAGTGALAAVGSWLGGTALVAAALAVAGTPAWLRPRPLYATGRSWLPVLGGVGLAAVGVAVGIRDAGSAAPLVLGGAVATVLGWFLRLMARNAEARARLDGVDALAWRARPARRRRHVWYASGGLFLAALLTVMLLFREWSVVGALGAGVALAARGADRTRYRLGGSTLVYGNPQVRYLLDAADVTGVEHTAGRIIVERRGWRPARTMDTADIEDPEAVTVALERFAASR